MGQILATSGLVTSDPFEMVVFPSVCCHISRIQAICDTPPQHLGRTQESVACSEPTGLPKSLQHYPYPGLVHQLVTPGCPQLGLGPGSAVLRACPPLPVSEGHSLFPKREERCPKLITSTPPTRRPLQGYKRWNGHDGETQSLKFFLQTQVCFHPKGDLRSISSTPPSLYMRGNTGSGPIKELISPAYSQQSSSPQSQCS